MEIKNGVLSLVAVTGMLTGLVNSSHAQEAKEIQTKPEQSQSESASGENDFRANIYHEGEFSIDGSAVGVLHSYDFNSAGLNRENYRFGGDLGGSLFATKCLGISGDAYALGGTSRTFVDTVTGNLVFRIPIGDTGLAPYVFGGAGYQFQHIDQIVGGGGVGLEFRIVRHFGIFADARYLAAAKASDYGFARAGIRISF